MLAERLGGERVAPGLIRLRRGFPVGARHGQRDLPRELDASFRSLGHRVGPALFLDTETTGLSGGTGTVPFLIGVARLETGGLVLEQYLLTAFAGEQALLEAVSACLAGIATLVTFNGKAFDAPLLAARYRLNRMPDPLAPVGHLDLLHPTRAAYGRRWADCRLQTAEREVLGVARCGDLPGSEVPEVWFHWVRHGDARRLPAVLEHNRLDVLSLATLLPALAEAYREPVRHAADPAAVARGRTRRGEGDAAYAYLLEHQEGLDDRGLRLLATMARGRAAWPVATGVWTQLAEQGDPEALEALAKYHEHVACDPRAALPLARRLAASGARAPSSLEARLARLQRKVARMEGAPRAGPAPVSRPAGRLAP
jgi:hypothetical protein